MFLVPFKKINKNNLQPFNQRYLKMETIFMNNENSKANEPHRFSLSFTDKLNPKKSNKNIALGNLSICYTRKNIKSAYNNNNFKISAPTWNDTFCSNLIGLMVLILLQLFKIIFDLSSKNMKL